MRLTFGEDEAAVDVVMDPESLEWTSDDAVLALLLNTFTEAAMVEYQPGEGHPAGFVWRKSLERLHPSRYFNDWQPAERPGTIY